MKIAIIIPIVIAALLVIYIFRLREQIPYITQVNHERERTNEIIELRIKENQEQLRSIKEEISNQTQVVETLTKTAEEMERSAADRANAEYNRKTKELEAQFEIARTNLENKFQVTKQSLDNEYNKAKSQLDDIISKQKAYIQAQKRQEAIAANQDYYRLAIDDDALDDVALLRDIQKRLIKKESIDKIIWEVYYKPAYDILMSHLYKDKKDKVCGIYMITDLTTGLKYIGQSVDCKERARQHIKAGLAHGGATNKLYQAMKKAGPHNFTFELLEEVPKDRLNEREKYWIGFYQADEQLNSTSGGS